MADSREKFRAVVTSAAFHLALSKAMIDYILCFDELDLRDVEGVKRAHDALRGGNACTIDGMRFAICGGAVHPSGCNGLTSNAVLRRGLIECSLDPIGFHLSEVGRAVVVLLRMAGFERISDRALQDAIDQVNNA